MKKIQRLLSFIRWRIILFRHITRVASFSLSKIFASPPVYLEKTRIIQKNGVLDNEKIDLSQVEEMEKIYLPRLKNFVEPLTRYAFVNLFKPEDINTKNPIMQYALSRNILDIANDYFHGKFIFDSIQVLHSFERSNAPRESQLWHLDYADKKTLHFILYLSDVLELDDGPFTYIDKNKSNIFKNCFFINRLRDEDILKKINPEEIRPFLGRKGANIVVDPSSCYHFGSRCKKSSRLCVFVTFNSWFPFVRPHPFMSQNKKTFFEIARTIRKDLNEDFLKSVFQLK